MTSTARARQNGEALGNARELRWIRLEDVGHIEPRSSSGCSDCGVHRRSFDEIRLVAEGVSLLNDKIERVGAKLDEKFTSLDIRVTRLEAAADSRR